MILTIFVLFLALGFISTIIGFAYNNSLFTIVGSLLIFFMGLSVMESPLMYSTGDNLTLTYGTNLTNVWDSNGGEIPNSSDVYVFSTTTNSIYTSYDDAGQFRLASIIMFLGILSFIVGLYTIEV